MDRSMSIIHALVVAGQEVTAVCRVVDCRHRQYVNLAEVEKHVGLRHPILPREGQVHYSERLRCPKCGARGMFVWPKERKLVPPPQPNYRILSWGRTYPYNHMIEMATAENLMVARGAFIAAASFYSDHKMTLQQGAFVLEDSHEKGIPEPLSKDDYKNMRDAEMNSALGTLPGKE